MADRSDAKTQTEARDTAPGHGSALVYVLVPEGPRSGEGTVDPAVAQALREAGGDVQSYDAPRALAAALREEPPALVVLDLGTDAEGERTPPARLAFAELPVAGVPVLHLYPATTDPSALPHGEGVAYLRRPFPRRALTAYAASLLRLAAVPAAGVRRAAAPTEIGTGEAAGNRLAVPPTLFSANDLYGRATGYVEDSLEAARSGALPDLERGVELAKEIHSWLLEDNTLLLKAMEPHSPYALTEHCVNVALLAGKLSLDVETDPEQQRRTVLAGLLHDIGMSKLPESLLLKTAPLTQAEYAEVHRHPIYGRQLLAELPDEYEWLRRTVHQEHERVRGQGYPQGLSGDAIEPRAQLIGVADVFEAFSHPRSYRTPFPAFDALEKVVAMRGDQFAESFVAALVNQVSLFPTGSYVLLNSGEIARVRTINHANLLRPTVEVVWDADWRLVDEGERIDLEERTETAIVRPLLASELPIT